MRDDASVDRPVLIVGCGRSGTTIVYDVLCAHEDAAWFSNYTVRWPQRPQLAVLSRAYPIGRRLGIRRHRMPWPVPSEGHRLWDQIRSPDDQLDSRPLTEVDVQPGEAQRAERLLLAHQRYQRKPRFVNKNTRNVRRVRYLNGMLPDCLVIHVLRHPAATISSLMRVAFWPDLPVWCCANQTPREWVASGGREEVIAAELWRNDVGTALAHAEALPSDRYLEVRYEDLVSEPRLTLERMLAFAGFTWTERFERVFRTFSIGTRAHRHGALSDDQLADILPIVGPLSERLGYS